MDSRERVLRVLNGDVPDRVPTDDGFWQLTEDRWRREGLPEGVSPRDYFGVNEIVRLGGDYTMQLPIRLAEDRGMVREYWDHDGALKRDLHTDDGWTSQWVDFSIKTKEDWAKFRQNMAYSPSRLPDSLLDSYRQARAEGRYVSYSAHACFHPTWMRVGMERMFMLMIEDPEFIYDMNATHAQLVIDIFEGMRKIGIEFDGAFLADDLGYQAAPLISPQMYGELVMPHHQRLCDHFASYGLKTVLHSDGNVGPLIPQFLEAGFTGLNPLETKAGLDVRELKPIYGDRLVFYGNIDVRELSGTKEDVEREITSKVPVAMENGGYIYHSDHSVPRSVPFGNYVYAMELVRKLGRYD